PEDFYPRCGRWLRHGFPRKTTPKALLSSVSPSAKFWRDSPPRVVRRGRYHPDLMTPSCEPLGHLSRVFPNSNGFRGEVNAANRNSHQLGLSPNCEQTIATPQFVSDPQRRKENEPCKHHEQQNQKRIS